jgi:hypothetical protein
VNFRLELGAQEESYAGKVLLPSIHTNLGNVMERPFGAIQFSRASVDPLDFLDTSSTVALREWRGERDRGFRGLTLFPWASSYAPSYRLYGF